MPFLSIIVPVYNVEEFLSQCIDSLLSQTFNDYEIILINDGSTDSSPKICDNYAIKNSQIKVIHKINGGQNSARRAGLSVANGRYIGFVDSDDWIEQEMFNKMCLQARLHDTDIVVCDYAICKKGTKEPIRYNYRSGLYTKNEINTEIIPTMIFSGNFFVYGLSASLWNKLFKKTLLQKHFGNDTDLLFGEDAIVVFPYILEANSLFYLKDFIAYNYRFNTESISNQINHNYHKEKLKYALRLKSILSKYVNYNFEEQMNYLFSSILFNTISKVLKNLCLSSIKDLHRYLNELLTNCEIHNAIRKIDLSYLRVKDKIFILLLRHKAIKTLLFIIYLNRKLKKIIDIEHKD